MGVAPWRVAAVYPSEPTRTNCHERDLSVLQETAIGDHPWQIWRLSLRPLRCRGYINIYDTQKPCGVIFPGWLSPAQAIFNHQRVYSSCLVTDGDERACGMSVESAYW